MAAVEALAQLAKQSVPEQVNIAYEETLNFGKDYIIPKPFDPRLIALARLPLPKRPLPPVLPKSPLMIGSGMRPNWPNDWEVIKNSPNDTRSGQICPQVYRFSEATIWT